MNLTTKKETITFGEKKILGIFKKKLQFIVEADVPESILDDYAVISTYQGDENDPTVQKKMFALMKKVIIGILSKNNKLKKVEKFVAQLGLKTTNEIFTFLNNYVNAVDNEKKND